MSEELKNPNNEKPLTEVQQSLRRGAWWERGHSKLNREQILHVLKWLVEGRSCQETADLVFEKWEIKICAQNVWQFKHSKKWKDTFDKLRIQFRNEILKLPIATKEGRVYYLQQILKEAMTWSLKSVSKEGHEIYELKLGDAAKAVQIAREELEGLGPLIETHNHYHFENLTDSQVIERCREKGIDLPAFVEGRIAESNGKKLDEVF